MILNDISEGFDTFASGMKCLALILSLLVAAPRFVNYGAADGLPSNTVYALAQDADGTLWVGTRNGLASFDGKRFLSFKEYGRVNALTVDAEGRLWVGTTEGLAVIQEGDSSPSVQNDRELFHT